MPKASVTEDSPYPIPADVVLNADLTACEQVAIEYTKKDGSPATFVKWEWTFRVTDGEYAGFEVRGNTEPKVTNATEASGSLSLALPYVEALLGRSIGLGEDVDTDDLIGLPVKLTVRHLEPRPRKNGDGFWFNVEVDEIYPALATNGGNPAGNVVPF
jgi:hypothetical protein